MEIMMKQNIFTAQVASAQQEVRGWTESKKDSVQLEGRSSERALRKTQSEHEPKHAKAMHTGRK